MHFRLWVASSITILVTLAAVIAAPEPANALHVDRTCKTAEAIFARGSGDGPSEDEEASRFIREWSRRVPDDKVSQYTYTLGTEKVGGYQYQHINVGNVFNGNAIGAKVTAGYGNDYGKSVDSGIGELKAYLSQRHQKCPNTFFVLGGYSQGAQVMGQALPQLSQEIRDKVVFVALFGDPKLYFPEGEGFNPPACQGKEWSPYRRLLGNCDLDNGSLGARKPYLPADMMNKTGLWCRDKDFVCGTSYNPYDSGHGEYKVVGGDIDRAVREAAEHLKQALKPEDAVNVDVRLLQPGVGTTGLDVVFVIDTTGSMGGPINQAKEFARTSAAMIKSMRGRVALVAYKDAGDEYAAKLMSGFDDDQTDFQAKLDGLTASGGGDSPEGLLHALNVAFDGLDWKAGATKAAVVLTDEGYHNPDKADGATEESIAKRALEIDPVNVYAVVPSYIEERYTALTEKTSGQIISNEGDTAAALTTALTKIKNRPTALLKLSEYSAEPGQGIHFDASDSYVIDAEITKYEWDFDGNGVFDQTTTEPMVDHIYTEKFNGHMQVRLTANNSTIASASAAVKIGTKEQPVLPEAPKNLAVKVLETKDGQSNIRLSWQLPSNNRAAFWMLRMDGMPMGRMAPDQTSVEITDVIRNKDVTFSIEGVLDDYTPGAAATITLKKEAPKPESEDCLTKLLAWLQHLWDIWQCEIAVGDGTTRKVKV